MDTNPDLDRQMETARAALLARYAPETKIRRLRWSQGETQLMELGAGPPLLLVHGGLDSADEWVPILSALARKHRVLAIDRPGHGRADYFDYRGVDLTEHARTFLREVLDALDLPSVAMVGNSMGGFWSVVHALAAPERVSRLVLVGKPVGCSRKVPLPLFFLGLPLLGTSIGRWMMSNPTREANRKFWGLIQVSRPEALDDTLLDADIAHMRRNLEGMLALVRRIAGFPGIRRNLVLGDRWRALKVPTLFLWGERDAFGPPDEGEAIAAQNPYLEMVRIPGAGHLPWLDDGDRVVDEIERFLSRPTPQ